MTKEQALSQIPNYNSYLHKFFLKSQITYELIEIKIMLEKGSETNWHLIGILKYKLVIDHTTPDSLENILNPNIYSPL